MTRDPDTHAALLRRRICAHDITIRRTHVLLHTTGYTFLDLGA